MLDIESVFTSGKIKFIRLANADGKCWYLPAKNMRTAMELYQPSGTKGIWLKRLFPLLHRLPLVKSIIHADVVEGRLDDEIVQQACQSLGVDGLEYSVFGGTPSVHQKLTIQFFKGETVLGYGKITDSEDINKLFVREESLLRFLRDKGLDHIPECLSVSRLSSGNTLMLQTTEKQLDSYSPNDWTSLHETFLKELTEKTAMSIPFSESDFGQSITRLAGMLSYIPQECRTIISDSIELTIKDMGDTNHQFSAYHGDFTPWNMLVNGSNLYVFDWEYAERTYPSGFDKFHFHVQQYIHVEHLSAEDIYHRIIAYNWYDATIFRGYLLDMISRFVGRENGKISHQLSQMLAIWTRLLTYTNQRPTAGDQQPATNNQQPATNNQQPATNNQQPTTNNQRPTTNNQKPN